MQDNRTFCQSFKNVAFGSAFHIKLIVNVSIFNFKYRGLVRTNSSRSSTIKRHTIFHIKEKTYISLQLRLVYSKIYINFYFVTQKIVAKHPFWSAHLQSTFFFYNKSRILLNALCNSTETFQMKLIKNSPWKNITFVFTLCDILERNDSARPNFLFGRISTLIGFASLRRF